MGRFASSRTLNEEECTKAMEGIVFNGWSKYKKGSMKTKPDLSEAPGAYKDIDEVIASQTDLVEVVMKVRPIGVVKG